MRNQISQSNHNEKLILHDIAHSVTITHSNYEQITNIIAGFPFARNHEARSHGMDTIPFLLRRVVEDFEGELANAETFVFGRHRKHENLTMLSVPPLNSNMVRKFFEDDLEVRFQKFCL